MGFDMILQDRVSKLRHCMSHLLRIAENTIYSASFVAQCPAQFFFATASFAMTGLTKDCQEAIVRVMSHICKFSTPLSHKIVYEDIFKGPFNEKTTDMLEIASKQREALMSSLTYGGSTPDPRAIVASCKEYYPTLWSLTESIVHNGETKVTMKKKYKFAWTSVLDRRQKASHWTNPAMVFELMEILVLQGLQTSNVAANCSATGDYVSAAKYLREAAGTLLYVAENLVPKWENIPPLIPFETNGNVLRALANVMQAQAQQMAIAKVLSSGKQVPTALLSKLYIGCIAFYDEAASFLRKLEKKDFDLLDTVLLEVCGFVPKLLRTEAMRSMAADYYEKGKYGYAAAYAEGAGKIASTISMLQSKALHEIQPKVSSLISAAQEMGNVYVEENSTVFFEPGPDGGVPPIESKTMDVSPVEFKTPAVSYVSFEVVAAAAPSTAPSTFFSGLLGRSSKPSSTKSISTVTNGGDIEANVTTLVSMGFDQDAARSALMVSNNDLNVAMDKMGEGGSSPKPVVTAEDSSGLESKVNMCVSMGFEAHLARAVLPTVDYDVSKAIDKLVLASASAPSVVDNKASDEDVLEILLPAGVRPGQVISVKDPRDDQIYRVQVPSGAGGGTKMQVATNFKRK